MAAFIGLEPHMSGLGSDGSGAVMAGIFIVGCFILAGAVLGAIGGWVCGKAIMQSRRDRTRTAPGAAADRPRD
jgi:hypothetical protein